MSRGPGHQSHGLATATCSSSGLLRCGRRVTKTVTIGCDSPLSRGVTASHRVTGNPLILLTRPHGTARHSQLPQLGVAASAPVARSIQTPWIFESSRIRAELPPSGEDVMLCDSEMVTRTGGSRTRPRPPGRNADDPGWAARVSAEAASAGIPTSSLETRPEFPRRAVSRRVACPN